MFDYAWTGEASFAALFLSSLLSGTLLPGSSEALLLWMAEQGVYDHWKLLWVASTGNTMGGMLSWMLGRLIARGVSPWRVLGARLHERAVRRIERWGAPMLLLAWVPILGDPLCVAAGWVRTGAFASFCYIAIGKTLRYALLLSIW